MSETHTCSKGCCTIKIRNDYTSKPSSRRGNCPKAGVFFYDPEENRALLVQSRGRLWGPPKGSVELQNDETIPECAIREVREETGLEVTLEDFISATIINKNAVYYFVKKRICPVEIQDLENNDANGITWIKLDCLEECIQSGAIVMNNHSKKVFRKFLNRSFPKCDFTVVDRRKRRK